MYLTSLGFGFREYPKHELKLIDHNSSYYGYHIVLANHMANHGLLDKLEVKNGPQTDLDEHTIIESK